MELLHLTLTLHPKISVVDTDKLHKRSAQTNIAALHCAYYVWPVSESVACVPEIHCCCMGAVAHSLVDFCHVYYHSHLDLPWRNPDSAGSNINHSTY